jgi:TolB-like protein
MIIVTRHDDFRHIRFTSCFAYCRGIQTYLMTIDEKKSGNCIFSADSVNNHLQKLLADPLFSLSDILKRFLVFIVEETLEGRSDQLKEYTIGVKVLHKPANFNPQMDAIVRIHACRLRRALNRYYEGAGNRDSLRISVPKGNYIPFFYESLPARQEKNQTLDSSQAILELEQEDLVAAVMPFSYFENQPSVLSMAEGLASQLSTELASMPNLSVIAYNPIRFLDDRPVYLRELILKAGAQFLITGDLQCQDTRLRVNIQLVNTHTYEQIWSKLFKYVLHSTNMFDIQDKIVKQVLLQVEDFLHSKKIRLAKSSKMAVA